MSDLLEKIESVRRMNRVEVGGGIIREDPAISRFCDILETLSTRDSNPEPVPDYYEAHNILMSFAEKFKNATCGEEAGRLGIELADALVDYTDRHKAKP